MELIKISEAGGDLKPFVRYFLLREFDTMGEEWEMPCFARNECFIPFCLESRYKGFTRSLETGSTMAGGDVSERSLALGISTGMAGTVVHKGYYRIFYIQFTPNGFHSIFGIPSQLFTNCFFELETVAGNTARDLLQRLQESDDLHSMAAHATSFLQHHLSKRRKIHSTNVIPSLSALLQSGCNQMNIAELAAMANMSQRTLERRFIEQIGVSPKLFNRIGRFNKAMHMKIRHPEMAWTQIAHSCQYYDQMHMVKEFKQFAGKSPSYFTKSSFPLTEHFLAL